MREEGGPPVSVTKAARTSGGGGAAATPRTEEAYLGWIRRFILFHGRRHPVELGKTEVTAFLSHLATARRVSASTQNQALSALLFLYERVLGRELEWLDDFVRAKAPGRLPVVLTRDEVRAVLRNLQGAPRLVAMVLYGSGLQLLEGLRLRVKDVDFERGEIVVRSGKGGRDRRTMLPRGVVDELRSHLETVRAVHAQDLMRRHRDVSTTMIYRLVLNRGGRGVRSPLDGVV